MLKDKWTGSLGVALGADRVLIGSRLQLLSFEGAMRIVTIAIAQQPLIDLVMEWLRERRLHLGVAGVAELRLRDFEQIGFALKGVWAVTVGAAHLGVAMRVAMRGAFEVGMRSGVAGQTAGVHLLRRSLFKNEYFGLVAAAVDVIGAGPVATFATLVRWPAFGIQRCFPVRRFRPTVVKIFVTRLAGIRAYVFGIVRRCSGLCFCLCLCRAAGRAAGLQFVFFRRLLGLTQRCGRAEQPQEGEQNEK